MDQAKIIRLVSDYVCSLWLGLFYQAITQYLGFYNYGDEYRLWMAGYGVPRFEKEMNQIVHFSKMGSLN